jgi:hypothetical protein
MPDICFVVYVRGDEKGADWVGEDNEFLFMLRDGKATTGGLGASSLADQIFVVLERGKDSSE